MSWDDLIGVAWLEGGRSEREGLDCLGVVLVGLDRIGMPMLDVWQYWRGQYAEGWRDYEEAVPEGWAWHTAVGCYRQGDIIVTRDRGMPRHLGLVVRSRGELRVLTSSEAFGSMLMSLSEGARNLEGVVRRQEP